jgi:hypothetical protein
MADILAASLENKWYDSIQRWIKILGRLIEVINGEDLQARLGHHGLRFVNISALKHKIGRTQ